MEGYKQSNDKLMKGVEVRNQRDKLRGRTLRKQIYQTKEKRKGIHGSIYGFSYSSYAKQEH